jgi:prolyl oligopeptidase
MSNPFMSATEDSHVTEVTDNWHGTSVADPYRWLEAQDSKATRQFIETQTGRTRSYLDALPRREVIRRRIGEMLRTEEIKGIRRVGARYFYLKVTPEKEQPVIAMREADSSVETVLVDPNSWNTHGSVSVHLLSVSWDGRLLAFGVKHGGEDAQTIQTLDVEIRSVLPDCLPRGFVRGFAFSPDCRGFFYVIEHLTSPITSLHASYHHKIGDDFANDRCLYNAGNDPRTRFTMSVSKDGRYAVYYVRHMQGSEKIRNNYLQHLPTLEVTHLPNPQGAIRFRLGFLENRLLASVRFPTGTISIFEVNPAAPSQSSWQHIFTDKTQNVSGVLLHGDRIFVSRIREFSTRTEILDKVGACQGSIRYPSRGTATLMPVEGTEHELLIHFNSFLQPPTVYRYSPQTGELATWTQKQVPFNSNAFEQSEFWYTSTDGTPIHMFLVSCKDLPKHQPAPTILTSYGGFGTNMTPKFSVFVTFMLEQGCRFALPNIRGGSELGRQWHEAGKRRNRQNAFDDFIAAAEWLIKNGFTNAKKLAIFGGSNSGLLVGTAMTQRPDLFRAVLCIAPILDMLRYDQFDRAYQWVDEFGVASDPEDFPVLYSYSPYHKVKDGTAYPATMFVSGDADQRCNPMHVRKMVARLQAANSAATPILMDYSTIRGHSPNMPLRVRVEALTDRLAFICDQLGIQIKEGGAPCAG